MPTNKQPTISFTYNGKFYTFPFKDPNAAGITIRGPIMNDSDDPIIRGITLRPLKTNNFTYQPALPTLYGGYTYEELMELIKKEDATNANR